MMMIRDIRKALKGYDFTYFIGEEWLQVLSEAGVKGITEILKERVLSKRWYLRDVCDSEEDFRWAIEDSGVDMEWTAIPNVFGHWTESQDYMDDPHTRLHTWMNYKGWLKEEYECEPSSMEDKELMYDLGLVKEGWSRLTDNGIKLKTWESEDWFE